MSVSPSELAGEGAGDAAGGTTEGRTQKQAPTSELPWQQPLLADTRHVSQDHVIWRREDSVTFREKSAKSTVRILVLIWDYLWKQFLKRSARAVCQKKQDQRVTHSPDALPGRKSRTCMKTAAQWRLTHLGRIQTRDPGRIRTTRTRPGSALTPRPTRTHAGGGSRSRRSTWRSFYVSCAPRGSSDVRATVRETSSYHGDTGTSCVDHSWRLLLLTNCRGRLTGVCL